MNTEPTGPFPPDENGCICPQDFTRPDCPACRSIGGNDRTSYYVQWKRKPAAHRPRPDYITTPDAETFYTTSGEPLFTVVTHSGPSEGIFTLIAEAPRIRDEGDREQRQVNAYVANLERIVGHIAGMSERFEYVQIPRQMVIDAKDALDG